MYLYNDPLFYNMCRISCFLMQRSIWKPFWKQIMTKRKFRPALEAFEQRYRPTILSWTKKLTLLSWTKKLTLLSWTKNWLFCHGLKKLTLLSAIKKLTLLFWTKRLTLLSWTKKLTLLYMILTQIGTCLLSIWQFVLFRTLRWQKYFFGEIICLINLMYIRNLFT